MTGGSRGLVLLALIAMATQACALPVELSTANFTTSMQSFHDLAPTRWIVMEFYANWCPHCQHFQPTYNQLADYFDKQALEDPQSAITVARLDCAENSEVCNEFSVTHYPTLKIGRAAAFAGRKMEDLTHLVQRSLQNMVDDVSKHAGIASHQAEAELPEGGHAEGDRGVQPHTHLQILKPEAERADVVDIEGATIKSWEYAVATSALMTGPDARAALGAWLELLVQAHPVGRCREGAAEILVSMVSLWPEGKEEPSPKLGRTPICGHDAEFKGWSKCKGSLPLSRGYTCGLWQLFHSLAVRQPDAEAAGAAYMQTLGGFVRHYFQCRECATHFLQHLETEEARVVTTKQQAVRWMWATHNQVNERLAGEDEVGGGDPKFPHVQWPTHEVCGGCRRGGRGAGEGWADDEVLRFLENYYGFEGGSGAAPEVRRLRGVGLKRTSESGWLDATGLCSAVLLVVYLALRSSGQYTLRRSASSRLL